MAYQVLARKCRPQRFAEIVGQEHITRTLQNAILSNRVGHAYLFVGSRGIGKTTTARIFAKALNCEAGLVAEPCCACPSCLEIAAGASLDVIEIDGASHNKVEHVRELRENVQYTPARGRYKVYIIDEVHMLTPQAWNALLKTLEEPPPHIKFLFATTEPHKVLPTIVSRCQRFDLKRLSVKLIAGRLREIAAAERIAIDDGALVAIARAADGGMRDGQSIFDQIISFCGAVGEAGRPIGETDVIDVFGLASAGELAETATALLEHDIAALLATVNGLADRGRDLERYFGDLILFFRNLMVCQVCRDPASLLDVSDAEMTDLKALAEQVEPGLVQRVLEGLVAEDSRLRNAMNKRVHLEAALAGVAREARGVQIDDILARLAKMRQGGAGPTAAPPPPAAAPRKLVLPGREKAPHPAAATPVLTAAAPVGTAATPPDRPPAVSAATSPAVPAPPPAPPAADATVSPAVPTIAGPATTPTVAAPPAEPVPVPPIAPAAVVVPPAEPAAAVVAPVAPVVAASAAAPSAYPAGETGASPSANPGLDVMESDDDAVEDMSADAPDWAEAEELAEPPPDMVEAAPAAVTEPSAEEVARLWHNVIAEVAKLPGRHQIKLYLQELRPISMRGGVLEVAYDDEFPAEHVRLIQLPENAELLGNVLRGLVPEANARVLLKHYIPGVSDDRRRRGRVASPEVRERVAGNPFVQGILRLFGGELVDVRG